MQKLTPVDLAGIVEEVKAEGKTRRVLWQDSESIAFLSSGRRERKDFHIDPADEVTLQLSGVQVLVYITPEGKQENAVIQAGQALLCPGGVPHSPRAEPIPRRQRAFDGRNVRQCHLYQPLRGGKLGHATGARCQVSAFDQRRRLVGQRRDALRSDVLHKTNPLPARVHRRCAQAAGAAWHAL